MRGSRGQSAMEVITDYGWAMIAVFVVGVIIWNTGMLESDERNYTAYGFEAVKPQTASVQMSYQDGAAYGFTGLFMNLQGSNIVVRDVDVVFEGATCRNIFLDNNRGIQDMSQMTCISNVADLPVKKGEHFLVEAEICTKDCTGTWDDTYYDTQKITVKITYETSLSGVRIQKTSMGEIQGPVRKH